MSVKNLTANIGPKKWYRIAVGSFFFVQGLVFASWASRIPDIKNALELSDAALGGVLFFIPIGQLSAMALSGFLVSRYGSRRMLLIGALLYSAALVVLGAAGSVLQLSLGLIFFGMSANLCNISVNTQGVGVERIYGRSIMGTFHGLWSLAGFFGGLISTLMVGLSITPFFHFCIIYILALSMILAMRDKTLPRDQERQPRLDTKVGRNVHYGSAEDIEKLVTHPEPVVAQKKPIFTRPDKYIIILGMIAFGSMICEGTMFEWSSVYFEQVIDPPKTLIRLGYIAAMCSMAGGRFMADKFITRFGVVNVLRVSGVVVALGLITAVSFPYIVPATIGFFFVGLGVSSIVPICYSMAGKSKTMLPGVALATVSTIGFLGFLLGPPVIGFVAEALSLRWSLGLISIVGLLATVLAPTLKNK